MRDPLSRGMNWHGGATKTAHLLNPFWLLFRPLWELVSFLSLQDVFLFTVSLLAFSHVWPKFCLELFHCLPRTVVFCLSKKKRHAHFLVWLFESLFLPVVWTGDKCGRRKIALALQMRQKFWKEMHRKQLDYFEIEPYCLISLFYLSLIYHL